MHHTVRFAKRGRKGEKGVELVFYMHVLMILENCQPGSKKYLNLTVSH